MRILFVNHNISLWINVGLTYVMSAVAESHDVFLVDRMKHQKNFDTYLLSALAKINPHIIALSVNSYTVNEACMLARAVRSSFPDIIVVFGGVHPTIMPEETIVLQDVDAIVVGEGELSFLEYANCFKERREPYGVQGVWFKDKVGNIVRNPLRPFTEDLESLPWPRWDFWDIEDYLRDGEIVPGTLRVLTTRGCPFSCSFCSNPIWQKNIPGNYYRKRIPAKIIDEIEHNFNQYKDKGFTFLMISDSIFGLDRSQAVEFCQLYQERGLARKLPWGAQMRCGTIDTEFANLLRTSGCRRITVSIESGNEYMRNQVYKKKLDREDIRNAVRTLQKAGIVIRAFVMLGGPDETRSMFDETLLFIKRIGLSISDLIIIRYVPLPKTDLTASVAEQDKVIYSSPFGYKGIMTIRSKIPYYYFLKIRILKIVSFLKEGFMLRGHRFLTDIITVLYKNGKRRFIPLVYLCSEQRLINWTLVHYKVKRLTKQPILK